eukprot:Gb_24877 [translate_table: standard]
MALWRNRRVAVANGGAGGYGAASRRSPYLEQGVEVINPTKTGLNCRRKLVKTDGPRISSSALQTKPRNQYAMGSLKVGRLGPGKPKKSC